MSKQTHRSRKSSWATRPVSAIADVNPTMPLPRENDGVSVPLYDMAAIDEGNGELREPQIVPLQSCRSGRTKFRNGDVLFAKITPCVQNGKSALVKGVPGDLAFGSSEFYVLRPHPAVLPHFLFYFIRQRRVVEAAVASFTGTSGRQRVPRGFWDTIQIPVPPLPVQERIVEILTKADDIRRKRQEAIRFVDDVLPAMFRELFGEPEQNPKGWDVTTVGNCLEESRYGTSEKTATFGSGDPVLRIPNVVRGTIDTSDVKFLRVGPSERRKLLMRPGDVLVVRTNGNKEYVGRCAVFDLSEDYLFASYLIRLRVDQSKLHPQYLAAFLATPYGRRQIETHSRTSAGQYNISSTALRDIRIPLPPMSAQLKFVSQYDQWKATKQRCESALGEAESTLASLLLRAFTGELTADWEQANADAIAKSQQLQENLPRLALLAVLTEATRRKGTAVLVTSLMKYLFLLQMETNGRRRLYQFVPYHYGPFARELYADLERLQEEGLITVDTDTEENKTRIRTADPQRIEKVLGELPDDLRDDVCAILDEYGELDHNRLLKTVYKKYPAYAKNSRLRKKTTKKAAKRSRRPK